MCSYFCEYIANMFSPTIHLRSLSCKDQPFVRTSEHQTEFDVLKQILISPSVMLYHLNWDLPFEVHVDASKHGVGAMLAQNHNGHIRPVQFLSQAFNKAKSNWNTTYQALYAVQYALEQFHSYVIGSKCKVVSDHANLKWLTSITPKQAKMARWCVSLTEYDFFIEHYDSVKNVVPDTLSHHPYEEGDNFSCPPIKVFMALTFSFDVPLHTSQLVQAALSFPTAALDLACLITPTFIPDPAQLIQPFQSCQPEHYDLSPTPPPSQDTDNSQSINAPKVINKSSPQVVPVISSVEPHSPLSDNVQLILFLQ